MCKSATQRLIPGSSGAVMKLTQLFVVFFLLLALPSFAATQQEDDNAARGVETSVANPQVAAPAAESGGNQPLPNPKNSKSDDDRSKQVLSLFTWFTDVESPDWITGVIYGVLSASMRDLFFPGDIIQPYSPDPYPFFSD